MENMMQSLTRQKYTFLGGVELSVRTYIEGTGKNCIAICQIDSSGKIHYTWDLDDDLDDFAKVLYHFIRKKPPVYKGYNLDSALSAPITDIVVEQWTELFTDQSDAIGAALVARLVEDEVVLKKFLERVSDIALESCSAAVRKKLINKLAEQIADSVRDGSLNAIGTHISHVAATTAGSTIVTTLAHILCKLIAMHATQIVAKILASAFLSHLIGAIAKKLILSAVLGFLAVHVGAAISGGALMFFAIPLIVAYLGWSIMTFPEKLGGKISSHLRSELDEKYESINRTILDKMWQDLINSDGVVNSIGRNPEFVSCMKTAAART